MHTHAHTHTTTTIITTTSTMSFACTSTTRFYDFPHGSISVEGKLSLDLDSDGLIKNFTVVSMGPNIIGYVEQLILGVQCVGYKYVQPQALSAEQQKLSEWAQATLSNMKVTGPSTIEFLFEEGVPYVARLVSPIDRGVVADTRDCNTPWPSC